MAQTSMNAAIVATLLGEDQYMTMKEIEVVAREQMLKIC